MGQGITTIRTIDPLNPDRPLDVLVVCTGNMCRSPMAEAMLRRRFEEAGVRVSLSSAGVTAEGKPATSSAIEVMSERGLHIGGHRSTLLNEIRIRCADLVLGMTREHVREVVAQVPDAFGRTFTLKELVRRAGELGPRPAGEPFDVWLARVAEGRVPADLLGSSRADDVADPMGRRMAVFERTADELAGLVDELVEQGWPNRAESDTSRVSAR